MFSKDSKRQVNGKTSQQNKAKASGNALIRGYWHREAAGGLSRSGASFVIGWRYISAFSDWPSTEVGTKIMEAFSYQSSPGHSEPIVLGVIF